MPTDRSLRRLLARWAAGARADAFRAALWAFDRWMALPGRRDVGTLVTMGAVLGTLIGMVGLGGLGIWAWAALLGLPSVHAWLPPGPERVATAVMVGGAWVLLVGRLAKSLAGWVLDATCPFYNREVDHVLADDDADPLLRQRCGRHWLTLLKDSSRLEWRVARWVWNSRRLRQARADGLERALPPAAPPGPASVAAVIHAPYSRGWPLALGGAAFNRASNAIRRQAAW